MVSATNGVLKKLLSNKKMSVALTVKSVYATDIF